MDKALEEFEEGLPCIAREVDKAEQTNLVYQLELLNTLYRDLLEERSQNAKVSFFISQNNDSCYDKDESTVNTYKGANKRQPKDPKKKEEESRLISKQSEFFKKYQYNGRVRKSDDLPDARTKEGKEAWEAWSIYERTGKMPAKESTNTSIIKINNKESKEETKVADLFANSQGKKSKDGLSNKTTTAGKEAQAKALN